MLLVFGWGTICFVIGCVDFVRHDSTRSSVLVGVATIAAAVFMSSFWYLPAGLIGYCLGYIVAGFATLLFFNITKKG